MVLAQFLMWLRIGLLLVVMSHPGQASAQNIAFWKVVKIEDGSGTREALELPTKEGHKVDLRRNGQLNADLELQIPADTSIKLISDTGVEVTLNAQFASIRSTRSADIGEGTISVASRAFKPFSVIYNRLVAAAKGTDYEVEIKPSAGGGATPMFCVTVREGAVQVLRFDPQPRGVVPLELLVGKDLEARWPNHRHKGCFAVDSASRLDHFQELGNAESAYRRALDLARESGDAVRIGNAWIDLARFLYELARHDSAIAEYDAASRDERISGINRFWILNNLGVALFRSGDFDGALARHAQAKAVADDLPWLQRTEAKAGNAINTGNALLEVDRIEAAIARYREAMELLEGRWGMRNRLVQARIALAAGASRAGKLCEAETQLLLARKDVRASGQCASDDVLTDLNFARVHLARGRYDDARRALEQADEKHKRYCRKAPLHLQTADLAQTWGDLEAATEQPAAAAERYQQALEVRTLLARDARVPIAELHRRLADAALARSQLDEAANQLDKANALIGVDPRWANEHPLLRADLLYSRGKLGIARNDLPAARRDLEASLELRRATLGDQPLRETEDTLTALKQVAQRLGDGTAEAEYDAQRSSMRSASASASVCR